MNCVLKAEDKFNKKKGKGLRKQVVESDGILGAKEARRDLGSGNNEKRGS